MRILLVQTSFLGDTVLSTPVIAGIKKLYPEAELWMLTTARASELVKRDPLLSGVLTWDKRGNESGISGLWRKARELRAMKLDRAYVIHRSARSAILMALSGIPERIGFKEASLSFLYNRLERRGVRSHDVLRNLAILESESPIQDLDQSLRLFAPEVGEVKAEVADFLAAGQRYALLAPGSAWATKMWDWRHYRECAKVLLEKGWRVVLVGAPQEAAVCAKVADGLDLQNFCGFGGLGEALLLARRAALVLCNDSLALHLASAFTVPTVTVFCSTTESFGFGPWNKRARLLEDKTLSCKPCGRHGLRACPKGHGRCMQSVTPADVLKAAAELVEL